MSLSNKFLPTNSLKSDKEFRIKIFGDFSYKRYVEKKLLFIFANLNNNNKPGTP